MSLKVYSDSVTLIAFIFCPLIGAIML